MFLIISNYPQMTCTGAGTAATRGRGTAPAPATTNHQKRADVEHHPLDHDLLSQPPVINPSFTRQIIGPEISPFSKYDTYTAKSLYCYKQVVQICTNSRTRFKIIPSDFCKHFLMLLKIVNFFPTRF